jgi:hypothetical protein
LEGKYAFQFTVFDPKMCTISNKQSFATYVSLPFSDFYKVNIRQKYKKAYQSKFCRRYERVELSYHPIMEIQGKLLQTVELYHLESKGK